MRFGWRSAVQIAGLQCIEFACASFRLRPRVECGLSKENAKSLWSRKITFLAPLLFDPTMLLRLI